MPGSRVNRRIKCSNVAMALVIAALPFAYLGAPPALAQAMMMRTPNLNIAPRTPTINPTVTPRVDPNVAGRTNIVTGVDRILPRVDVTPRITPRININPNSTMPVARFSPNLYPACDAANRDSDGECIDRTA